VRVSSWHALGRGEAVFGGWETQVRICNFLAECGLTLNSENRLDLIPMTKASTGPLEYAYDLAHRIRVPSAHGEEIVRDVFADVHVSFAIRVVGRGFC
jgi:hypothetical protein